jgi:hypothetical protein
MKSKLTIITASFLLASLTNIASAQLPDPGVEIVASRTALLITDSQPAISQGERR